MKKLLFIVMTLTLSSCMVSKKTFDDKCCKIESQITELENKSRGMEMKEQLLRQAVIDLQINKIDTIK